MEYFWDTGETIVPGMGFSHYDSLHLFWLVVFVITVIICCVWFRKMSDRGRSVFKKTIALSMLVMEVLKILLQVATGRFLWDIFLSTSAVSISS